MSPCHNNQICSSPRYFWRLRGAWEFHLEFATLAIEVPRRTWQHQNAPKWGVTIFVDVCWKQAYIYSNLYVPWLWYSMRLQNLNHLPDSRALVPIGQQTHESHPDKNSSRSEGAVAFVGLLKVIASSGVLSKSKHYSRRRQFLEKNDGCHSWIGLSCRRRQGLVFHGTLIGDI